MKNIILLICLVIVQMPLWAEVQLPVGNAPAPIPIYHFPSSLHTFIWRNWSLVEVEQLAKVLNTEPDRVREIAESMGLSVQPPIPDRENIYITLIRRNWHLLPYEQLLILLDMTAEQLAHSLREDDFLFIKLGSQKPSCEPLAYHIPSATETERAGEIKKLVQSYFKEELSLKPEPRYHFMNALKQIQPAQESDTIPDGRRFSPRYIYSYCAQYGDPLLDSELESYPEGLLQKLSQQGIDGIWVHTVLRQLAPSQLFPEFGEGHEIRLANLRKLVARAAQYGIGVYLYMNEPRTMPDDFFRNREELRGVRYGDYYALCTSTPEVRQWISDSLTHVFKEVAGLAGVFTITASENHTSCASHGRHDQCPRCGERKPSEIIAEVNATIAEGVRRGNPDARVIVWDWGWQDAWSEDAIRALPKTVWFQSVSEWSKPITRGGVQSVVGEYSISVVGPGPRALRHWAIAKEAGLKTVAKVQVNSTWEISAVPYLPVYDLIAEHCSALVKQEVNGLMLSWTLGSYPSPNLDLVQMFEATPAPSQEEALQRLAEKLFGAEAAPLVRKVWSQFSRAFQEYPYHGSVVYRNPVQFGPSNLLYPYPTGYPSTMVGFPYDDLKGWRGVFPAEVFIEQFSKVAMGWEKGISVLKNAVEQAPEPLKEGGEEQLRYARAAQIHFASVANQSRFVLLRNRLLQQPDSYSREAYGEDVKQLKQIIEDEMRISRDLYALTCEDSRIGFEASNHYYYVPNDLMEKVINCRYILDQIDTIYPHVSR